MTSKVVELYQIIRIPRGVPVWRHPAWEPIGAFPASRIPAHTNIVTCEQQIDPRTGMSKACDHGIRFVWGEL